MFPNFLVSPKHLLVLEKAWSKVCSLKFLSTQSVLRVGASKPVKNMLTTIKMSISQPFVFLFSPSKFFVFFGFNLSETFL